jgi:hypothetical protein
MKILEQLEFTRDYEARRIAVAVTAGVPPFEWDVERFRDYQERCRVYAADVLHWGGYPF